MASKLTGTVRSIVREPYFSNTEIRAAMVIVHRAERMTEGQTVKRRNWTPPVKEETPLTAEEIEESYEAKESKAIDTAAELLLDAPVETDTDE